MCYETRKQKFTKIHAEIPDIISQSCAKANVKKFIQVSAIGASSDSTSIYQRSKFEGEKRSLDNLHPYQKQALEYGADIRWVPNGMLQVTKARAREYFYEDPKRRRLLPLGLEEKRVFEDIRDLARNIEKDYNINISEVWSVGSSGT